MAKKTEKKGHRRSSSSSSQEDEKACRKKDVPKSSNAVKRGHESCAGKRDKSASSSSKSDFQRTCPIKKPMCRLTKTDTAEPKPPSEAEECTKKNKISFSIRGRNTFAKAKSSVSGKEKSASDSWTRERGHSAHVSADTSRRVPQSTERTPKGSSDAKPSRWSPSQLKKQRTPSSASAAQQTQNVAKKKSRWEEPAGAGRDPGRPRGTSLAPRETLLQKRMELVKRLRHRHGGVGVEAKCGRVPKETAAPAPSTPNRSSASAKHATSESSSRLPNSRARPCSLKTAASSSTQPPAPGYKIPRKAPWNAEATKRKAKQESAPAPDSFSGASPSFLSEGQSQRSSQRRVEAPEPQYDQVQVVEELHLARAEKKLEVDVTQSYGELTCMEIDSPEEGATDAYCRPPPQQDLIIVLDTNILLSHLDYVRKIASHGLGALGFPVVLIPWVVLQELDYLKKAKGSVAHLAPPAISYIHNALKSRGAHLWGQSMQQATDTSHDLAAENNDDRVLQCCLQYRTLYPGCALILCTNDKNLCSKALLSGVNALAKKDLEAEVARSRRGPRLLQNAAPQAPAGEREDPSAGRADKYNQRHSGPREEKGTRCNLSRCISELEECLREVLSDVLEAEMKAAFEELWLEIVYVKPPWTLQDVLSCLKKHWIAVFGHVVPRREQQTVLNLIQFFDLGKTVDSDDTFVAIHEAKQLVEAFRKSSRLVPGAISILDNISRQLKPQGEMVACDVVMNEDDADRQPEGSARVSHQAVWALFENVWSNVYQMSFQVFQALGFDPDTMRSAPPAGGPAPPRDAVACLHELSATVSQLLQAFSSVLSSVPCLETAQALLGVIHSNKIADVDSRLTAADVMGCFSQQEYRDKLRVGGSQLQGLKEALERCVGATGQDVAFTAPP